MANVASILQSFELQVSDNSELSSAEELMILNRVRRKINRRPLEANRKAFAGNQSTALPYISLPSDFYRIAQNYDYAYSQDESYGSSPTIIVGSSLTPVTLIPYADRNQYVNSTAYAYLDMPNNRLVFTAQPSAANSVAFDYYALPADLTATTDSDWLTNLFPDALVYGMATEDFILQLSDKARSYAPENQTKFKEEMAEIASWNLGLQNF